MKKPTPRRAFLRKSVMATTGITLFSSQVLSALTMSTSPYEGYNQFAEEKTDLRTQFFGKQLKVSGTIYDSQGALPLSEASVEVWHLSPGSSKYRHRGKFKTDALGQYQFHTDFPNKEKGKSGRIYFKVSKGETSYFTELVVSPFDAFVTAKHWKENSQLGEKVYPTHNVFLNEATIQFNISLSNNN